MSWRFHGDEELARSAANLLLLSAPAEVHMLDPESYVQELLTVLPL